jgi:vacuolar-type H+-ATPase subunit I/STV1
LISPFNKPEDPPRSSDTVTNKEMRELLGHNAALEQEVERLENKVEFLQRQRRQSDPRVIESLQKLAIGMACAGYRFDHTRGRNSATSDIRSDLDKLGIHLDDETILARLREAAELLPKDANEGEDP